VVARVTLASPELWIVGLLVFGFLVTSIIDLAARRGFRMTLETMGLTRAQMQRLSGLMGRSLQERHSGSALAVDESDLATFSSEERGTVLHWLYMNRLSVGRRRLIQRWRTSSPNVFISYAWRDDADLGASSGLAAACAAAGIDYFLDKTGVESKEGLW